MDRFHLLEESNKKVFTETNKILSKYNLEFQEEDEESKNSKYLILFFTNF